MNVETWIRDGKTVHVGFDPRTTVEGKPIEVATIERPMLEHLLVEAGYERQ